MRSASVTVNTSRKELFPALNSLAADTASGNRPGQFQSPYRVLILNTNATTIYLGGSDVTVNNGFPLAQDESVELELYGENLWAVAGGSVTGVKVLYHGDA